MTEVKVNSLYVHSDMCVSCRRRLISYTCNYVSVSSPDPVCDVTPALTVIDDVMSGERWSVR